MTTAEERLHDANNQFLVAFRNLDWPAFITAFAKQASVFFPFDDQPRRATGIGEITAIFLPFFTSVRQQRPGPPYLQLEPVDLQVTIVDKSALITFHLHDPGVLCRRTILWIDEGKQWRILHLHASNIAQSESKQG